MADEPGSTTAAEGGNSATDKLVQIISEGRQNRVVTRISEDELKAVDPAVAVAALARYDNDASAEVRRLAHLYKVRIARLHRVPAVSRQVTAGLVKALGDDSLRPAPYEGLVSFGAGDFSAATKAELRAALAASPEPEWRLVRAVGIAGIREELPRLEGLLFDEARYKREKQVLGYRKWYLMLGWSARLARARMGVKADIQKCLELVDSEEDETERVLRLLHDVGYIRQPEAIEYLRGYLSSSKRLPRVKETVPGELYSNYVMNILGECLENYPVELDESRAYTPEQIELCRRWMASQRTWNIRR